MTRPARCTDGVKWLRRRLGRDALAGLTGQDTHALLAAFHVLDLYMVADDAGRRAAEAALRALADAMQPKMRDLIAAAAPFAGDWGDEERVAAVLAGGAL